MLLITYFTTDRVLLSTFVLSEVTYSVPNYFNGFNVLKCGRNILDRLDVLYGRACMAIKSTISDSVYFGSEEHVDAKSKSEELVDTISDSEGKVDTVSEAKVYRH